MTGSSEDPADAISRMRADMDQAAEATTELARIMRRYYEELHEQGFSEAQALTIVISWQAAQLSSGSNDSE